MAIYVETLVRAPIDKVWTYTQDPALHEQWDVRFSRIEYLPRPDGDAPQRFRYTTRLGFGLSISGEGETTGGRARSGGRLASALRFWSAHPLSLIEEGSGFWKYVPKPDGVRFLTRYDYRPRFGLAGRAMDALFFRPIMSWATAWSFDRLRLWLEDGIRPQLSGRLALVHGIARIGLAAIFAWQGLLPKLLGPDPAEVEMIAAVGVPPDLLSAVVLIAGVGELVLAGLLLVLWHRAWPTLFALALTLAALVVVGWTSPAFIATAFNVVTLTVGVVGLALVDLLTIEGIPSAGRTLRRPPADR